MQAALEEAQKAFQEGEVPVGAVIVVDGQIIASNHNRTEQQRDPLAHAEMLVIRDACNVIQYERLIEASLYVTVEPCAMCAGAMVHARIERLVFGCADPRGGAAGSIFDVVNSPELNHRIAVTPGIRETECRDMLQRFFRARR